MSKETKYHTVDLFYLIPYHKGDVPTLYAFTDSKKKCKDFMEQRNMKKFIHIEKKLTEDELNQLMYHYKKSNLIYTKIKTKADGKRVTVDVLCTFREEEYAFISSDKLLYERISKLLFDPSIFKDKYLKVLEEIGFIQLYIFYYKNSSFYDEDFYNPYKDYQESIYRDFCMYDMVDDLAIFTEMYKDLFKN